MNRPRNLIYMAVIFAMTSGLLPAVRANEIPDDLAPRLIQATKNEIPASYHVKPSVKGGFAADNPAQRLLFGFTRGGIEISAGDESRWRMQLLSYGFDSKPTNIKPLLPKTNGARVDYEHEGMTEWYINSPFGMEQGFTFESPAAPKSKSLTLDIALEGEVKQKGNSLVFGTKDGRKIRYKGLQAFDAKGRPLDSKLLLQGKQLSIVVDVTDAAYPVTVDPLFSNETKITASDGTAFAEFGTSVAISGNTAIIGAGKDSVKAANDGSAYVFVRDGTTWIQQQKLTASDAAAGDYFGFRTAISGDIAVIGAAWNNANDLADSGSAYVFVRSGTTWTQRQKLTAADGASLDYFGQSVAISGDTIIIGALQNDNNNKANSGSAYVFVRNGNAWVQQQKLTASDATAEDFFGRSVAISGDTAIIGTGFDGAKSGSAYVFVRSETTWSEQQKLTASDGAENDQFGQSVAISGDTAAIGAAWNDNNSMIDSGSAYIFVRSGTTWSQQQKLTASDAAAGDFFGGEVSISGDTIVVTADGNTNNNTYFGSAYVFALNETTWIEQQKLTASDSEYGEKYGFHAAISDDTIIISASYDNDKGTQSGAAYIYQIPINPDFNSDGNADILWRNSSTGENIVWNMNGNVLLGANYPDAVADLNWKIAGLADFNNDTKVDILWRNYSTGQNYVWFMNGAIHTGGAYVDAVPDVDWKIVGAADFNGDNKPDIVWRNFSTGMNYIWFMDGTAHLGGSFFDAVPDTLWKIAGLGDFNKDGKTDILWRNYSTGQNYIWFMNGATHTIGAFIDWVAELDWNIVALADFNKDGSIDILWRNGMTGLNVIWYMNGILHTGGDYISGVADTNWKVATATP